MLFLEHSEADCNPKIPEEPHLEWSLLTQCKCCQTVEALAARQSSALEDISQELLASPEILRWVSTHTGSVISPVALLASGLGLCSSPAPPSLLQLRVEVNAEP